MDAGIVNAKKVYGKGMTDWQLEILERIERCISEKGKPVSLKIISGVLNVSYYTLRNWKKAGLFETDFEYFLHKGLCRKMVVVTSVNWPTTRVEPVYKGGKIG